MVKQLSIAAALAVLVGTPGNAQTTSPAGSQPAAPSAATQPTSQPAETQPAEAQKRPLDPFLGPKSLTMTGDWLGLRPALHDAGIDTNFYYNDHFLSVLGGGRNTGGGKNSSTIDWFITLDLEKLGVLEDADVLVQARQQWGLSVNDFTGANQQVNDDADGDRQLYVDQLWYRQYFLDRKLSLQLGYLDFQTIIDRNVYANSEDKQFMNAALDNNPIVPSAAITGLGAALTMSPVKWYALTLGAGDAQTVLYKPGFSTAFHDEAWFVSWMEHTLHLDIPTEDGPLPGNYRFGLVYDPRVRDVYVRPRQRPDRRGNDYGFYTSFDQMLFREGSGNANGQGLGAFFRYAYRHEDIQRFEHFWSAGLAYTGLLPERDRDVLGFAVGQLVASDRHRARINPASGNETLYELYYAIELTPWLVLSPDFQYVNNPGADDSISHAIVGGVRVRITF